MDENALRSKVNVEMTIEEERICQVQVQVQGQGSPVLGRVRRGGEGEKEEKRVGCSFLSTCKQAAVRSMYGYTAATIPLRSSAGEVSNEQVGSGDVQSAGDKTGWAGGAGLDWIGGGVPGRGTDEWQRRDTGL